MAKISVMSRQLANLIAAGEVVERPANIVKECVENALDAGADTISIEAWEGGIEKLVITDNGCGMDYEDAVLAFERHATSKLHNEEELFSISTMGFRGEALPSIAAVARVDLKTSYESKGTHVVMEYGERTVNEPYAAKDGTRMEISGLFLQTPARFKYLKKPVTEFAQISDLVSRLALSRPDVRFTLKHNDRLVFQTTGSGKMDEIFFQMFGMETAKSTRSFKVQDLDFTVEGLLVLPRISRANKKNIYLIVNDRIVRSFPIQNAILDGYAEYLPKERYPIACLKISCDPQLIDVNVHPNKWEIRLSKEVFLKQLIVQAIENALSDQMQTVQIQTGFEKLKTEPDEPADDFAGVQNSETPQTENSDYSAGSGNAFNSASGMSSRIFEKSALPENHRFYNPTPFLSPEKEQIQKPAASLNQQSETTSDEAGQIGYPVPKKEPVQPMLSLYENEEEEKASGKEALRNLKIIGQLKDSYILCQSHEGLVIIDQHAAQERYHFEQLLQKFSQPVTVVQPMMVPIKIQVDPAMLDMVDEVNRTYQDFGLHFEAFNGLYLLTAQPAWLMETDAVQFLEDLLSEWSETRKTNVLDVRRKTIATMACHSSIRFNRPLTEPEMEKVIEDLLKCDQPWHCPHGRPTVITLSDARLRREFERG